MIQSLLRRVSMAITVIVLLSFAMFVSDQSSASTSKEVATLNTENTPAAVQQPAPQRQPVEKRHGQPRRTIDDIDRQILKPFDGFASNSSSAWVRRGVPAGLALLVFGFGLNVLAGYIPRRPA